MESADTAQLAAVAGALGAALALLGRGRPPLLGGLALLAAAGLGLVVATGAGGVAGKLFSPAGAVLAPLALGALAACAAPFVRWPAAVPVAVLLAAPFRPPLEYDPDSPVLIAVAEGGQLGRLLPLYGVLAAAALALVWRVLRGHEPRGLPRSIARPAAAFMAFACLSVLWADDVEAGANLLLFFTLPFVLLLAVVARADFPAWAPRALGITGIALASLFALTGLAQAATHRLLFFAPSLEVSNANTDYFRVTSFFGDPSLYGRHVVLGLCIVLVVMALDRIRPWVGIALAVVMWAGLLFSFSQSSMTALVAVTLAVAATTGGARVRRVVAIAGGLALLGAAVFVAAKVVEGKSLNRLTSDRTERVEQTLSVIREDPLLGVGIGGQARASRRLARSDRPTANFVSHATPLTVAAELGVVGLGLYAWLLVGGARLIATVRGRHQALGLVLGAAFLALFVHALFYSGFLEDPLTWVVLGVGAGYLAFTDTPAARARERLARTRGEPAPVAS